MTPLMGWLRRRLFGISLDEVRIARRGFQPGNATAQERLEQIGATFLGGYHTALEQRNAQALAQRLNEVDLERRGFAYEGAAMALALVDGILPWRSNRWRLFLDGPGAAHAYMVHVGFGWAVARLASLRRRLDRIMSELDPLLRWLVIEGYGFHEGYFHWQQAVTGHALPEVLTGYSRRVFDQGLGRSMWFVDGADVERIAKTIATFEQARHPDLWSGAGLASAYAGGVSESALVALGDASGQHLPALAQGVAFAAKARQRAGNVAPHTELASEVLCGISAAKAASVTDQALEGLADWETRRQGDKETRRQGDKESGAVDSVSLSPCLPVSLSESPAFEVWRQRIQAHFTPQKVTA